MKKFLSSPVVWLLLIVLMIFWPFVFFGKVPLPVDTLVGAYLPWLDYKWGYIVGVPVKNALTSDAFSTFYVWKGLVIDLLRHGIFPLWNRYSFSGTPLLATFHTAVLFPANLLLLLPSGFGWGIFILLATIAAAFSMFLFLGTLVKEKASRVIGSLIYALAGPMTTWSQFGTAVWAASLLPLILYCLDGTIKGRRLIYFPLLTFLIGLLIFAGHVQLLTYTAVIAPLYFFYRQKKTLGKINPGLSLKVILAAGIGLGLGAVQLLPSLDFFARSIRSQENYASFFNFGLSHWTQAIRLWAADFFGNPVTINHFSSFSYHEYSSYLGVFVLPLIVSFLPNSFFSYLFFASLFLAFDNPISRFIFSLPLPLLTYSSASRIFFLTNLAAAVLAALSIDNLFAGKTSRRRLLFSGLFFAAVTLVAIFFVDGEHRAISLRNSSYYLSLLSAFLLSSVFIKNRFILSLLLVLLFSFDLGRYYAKYNPFVSRTFIFPDTPVTIFLKGQKPPFRIAREDTNLLPANSWTAYRLESVEGYDPLFSSDYAHYFHRLSGNPYENGVSRYALLEGINHKFLSAANVQYILTKNTTEASAKSYLAADLIKEGYLPVFTDKSVTVYADPVVKNRAYFVTKVRFAKDKAQMGRVLDDPQFDPTAEAVIMGEPFESNFGQNEVLAINHRDNEVEISVRSQDGGFLILSDAYDPGWRVYVDGTKTTLYQVNGAHRGVIIPAKTGQVTFRYEPASFKLGLVITLASLALTPLYLLGLHLTKRR
ncbi:MAG TPA: YfhO family protein [Patescibacteria group bacterium]|nr:YfhO family protein [Patescibacteria group bacterium]